MSTARRVSLAVASVALMAGSGCAPNPKGSSTDDVAPLLMKHCAACHTPGQAGYVVSGVEVLLYQALM